MKIIAKAKLKKFGNDCLIEKILTVVEVFDTYLTFSHTRYYGGWCDDKIREERWDWNNRDEAIESFKITIEQNKDYVEEIYETLDR